MIYLLLRSSETVIFPDQDRFTSQNIRAITCNTNVKIWTKLICWHGSMYIWPKSLGHKRHPRYLSNSSACSLSISELTDVYYPFCIYIFSIYTFCICGHYYISVQVHRCICVYYTVYRWTPYRQTLHTIQCIGGHWM